MPIDRMVEKVQLFFSARNLPNVHMFNKTDAFAALFIRDNATQILKAVAVTEVIQDNRSPKWVQSVVMEYYFEMVQDIVVKIYQHNSGPVHVNTLTSHEVIGEAKLLLSDVMRNGQNIEVDLTHPSESGDRGVLNIKAEPIVDCRDNFVMSLHGHKLVNKDGFFNTSDPFYTISRLNEDGSYTLVYRSESIDNNLSPKFKELRIGMTTLCNGDLDRPLLIEIRDKDNDGKSQSMGSVRTSVRSLVASNGTPYDVIEEKEKDKKGYKNSGTITANGCHIEHHPTFAEFITGGLEINLSVAVDFTGSNGDPFLPQSLHYIDGSGARLNQYEEAILSVGGILESYDTDKKFSAYGFGARLKTADGNYAPVSHQFPLNINGDHCDGVKGTLAAYHHRVSDVMFSGPTLIAPLINTAASRSECAPGNQKYRVLLILTDGTINDMDETKAAIIAASHKAISIIIIGVGDADFKDMQVLDGDKKALSAGGKTAARDIVQFVTYKEAVAAGAGKLAQQVLAEVPEQVLDFMKINGILPGKK